MPDGQIDEGCESPPPPPPDEICGDGIDNNSDGQIDEGCEPPPPPPPPSEVCGDGIDNNGNGQVDEGCSAPPPPPPPDEVCGDGIDNNGNGQVDEGCSAPPPPPPPDEICGDGIDNNSDGQIDEGCEPPPPPPPPSEVCGDGIDNNGDGQIDEGCEPLPPLPPSYSIGVAITATDPDAAEEGPDDGLFTISVWPEYHPGVTVSYNVGGTASPSDYSATNSDGQPGLSGTITIPAGQTSGTITITPVDDSLVEPAETLVVTLLPHVAGYYVIYGDPDATVTIADNDYAVVPTVVHSCTGADFQTTLERPAGVVDEILAAGALCGDVHFDFPTWAGFGRGFDGSALLPEWRSYQDARPIVAVDFRLPNPLPDQIEAQLDFEGTTSPPPVFYSTAGLAAGDVVRISVQADATALPSGHYDFKVRLISHHADGSVVMHSTDGTTELVNRSTSPFGDGWWLEGLDRLVLEGAPGQFPVTLIRGDNTAAYYPISGSVADGTLNSLAAIGSGYLLKNRWGDVWVFSAAGLLARFADRHGNVTSYTYADKNGDGQAEELVLVVDPYLRATRYLYTDGRVSKVIDHAGRETLFGRDAAGRTTSVTLPDPDGDGPLAAPVTHFAYNDDGLVTEIVDAATHETSIEYSFARRFHRITRPDSSFWKLRPIELVGLAHIAAGEGTQTNPAPLALADDAAAIYTNPRGHVTEIETDRFGYATLVVSPPIDPSGGMGAPGGPGGLGGGTTVQYETRYERTDVGLITRITEPDPDGTGPLGEPISRIVYNTQGNPTIVTRPDGEQIHFTYNGSGFVTQISGPGVLTKFSYNGLGRLSQIEDIAGVRYQISRGNVTQVTDLRNIDAFLAYDSLGRLITVTDELNKQTTYEYDTADNLTATTDRTFVRTEYSYDRLDRLGTVTYPQSVAYGSLVRYAYSYDAVGNLTAEVSPRNGVTRYEYDGLRRLTRVTDAVGGVTQWAYDPAGNVASTTDSVYRTTMFTYDPLDRATEVRRFPNFRTRYAYDAAGRVAELTDARGNATDYEYDIMGNLIAVVDAAGGQSEFQYNAAGWLTKAFDALDRETQYTYDAVGRVISIAQPLGFTTTFAYDLAGNLTRVDRPGGRHTSFVYDRLNRLERQEDAYGNPDTYLYDPEGRLLAHTDAVGRTSSVLYDTLGRVRREQDVLGYEQVYSRDADGNVIKVEGRDTWQLTWAASYVTLAEYEYDLIGRMTTATKYVDPADLAIRYVDEYEYDGVHRITRHEDAAGRVQSCQYDFWVPGAVPEDDAIRTECRLNTRAPWRRTYDGVGNLVSVTDPLGYSTAYEYDLLNQLTKITDARAGETRFAYDAVGNLVSLTDPVGNATTYVYDGLDRVTRETNQLGLSREYAYDAAGNLGAVTDRNGRVRHFQYDLLNRMVAEVWPTAGGAENTFTYSYDAVDRLSKAGDNNSDDTYTYTSPRSVTTDMAGTLPGAGAPDMPHVVWNELYDARGQRTALEATVDGTRDFSNTYEYDLLGRMTQVKQYGVAGGNAVGEKRVDFRYNALGQFTMIQRFRDLAGGQMAAYSQFGYDAYGNLASIEHHQPAGAMISQYSYTHDDLDRITSVVDPAGTTNYNYDEISQLVSADYSPLPTNPSPLPDESYSYDLNGNRTNTGYVTAADNRLEQAEIDGKLHSFQYDSEGNLIRRTNLNTGEVVEYTWDRRNRLVRVTERNTLDGPPTTDVSFTYDAFDRRIAKTVSYPSSLNPQPSSSELFVYDGIHIALVFTDPDASGPQPSTLDSRFLFGPAVDQVLAEEQMESNGTSKTYWLLADHLGSIRDVLSSNCTGGGHIDYTAFGRVAAVFDYLGARATLDAIAAKRFLFTGREYDAEIDLQFNRARYYDAAIARFIGQDPISFGGGDANLYRYVGNEAVSQTDPSGLVAEGPERPTQICRPSTTNCHSQQKEPREVDFDLIGKLRESEENRPRGEPESKPSEPVPYDPGVIYDPNQVEWPGWDWFIAKGFNEWVVAAGGGLTGQPGLGPSKPRKGDMILGKGGPPIRPPIEPLKPGASHGPTAGQGFPEHVVEETVGGNHCVFCGLPAEQGDHVIPRAKGGNATPENAQPACAHCNASKGAGVVPKTPPKGYPGRWPPPWWPWEWIQAWRQRWGYKDILPNGEAAITEFLETIWKQEENRRSR